MRSVLAKSKHVKVGLKNNKLEVIGHPFRIRNDAGKCTTFCVCLCKCGEIVATDANRVFNGNVRSCGCLSHRPGGRLTAVVKTYSTRRHGLAGHPLYDVYCGMVRRCNNPKSSGWKWYGARGIRVCQDWMDDRVAFINWGLSSGWQPGLQLDRIDNNGNYEPSNCRFVTRVQNMANTRIMERVRGAGND